MFSRFPPCDSLRNHPAGPDRTIVVCRTHAGQAWSDATHERDIMRSFLRGHHSDVYDLCWSPDSSHLVSGSVDNTCMVWDIASGRMVQTLKDHSNFVQGVAWDPRDRFIASESCDRSLRVYTRSTKKTGAPFKAAPQVRTRAKAP